MRMAVALIFVFSCLFSLIPGDMSAEVVVTRVGGVARLNCSSTNRDSLEWKRISRKEFSVSTNMDFIYADSWLIGKFSIEGRHNVSWNPQTGACDLVITNVNEDDAGKYICEETIGRKRSDFELVVLLVNNPTCRTNISLTNVLVDNDCDIDPDYIEFNCSIAYRGNVVPDMQLQMSSIGVLDNVTVRNWTHSTTKYMTVVWASKASLPMKGGQFRCKVTNTMAGIQPTCSSTQVSVIYFYEKNKTLEITFNDDNQDQRVCIANTSEHCTFKWNGTSRYSSKASVHLEVFGQTLDLKNRGFEHYAMRCHAECRIRNTDCFSEPMFIEFTSDKGGHSNGKYIFIGLGIASLIVICVFAVIYLVKRICLTRKELITRSYDIDLTLCNHADFLFGFKKLMEIGKVRELVDYIDLENGLLTELCKLKFIDESECLELQNTDPSDCNEKILGMLNSKLNSGDSEQLHRDGDVPGIQLQHLDVDENKLRQFHKALSGNGQDHIVRCIVAAGVETISVERLLPGTSRKVIDDNKYYLKKLIDTDKQDLLQMLVDENCITEQHKIKVVKSQPEDKAEALLELLKRRRSKDFWQFIMCLRSTKQTNAAKILENGEVWEIEVKLKEQSDPATIENELIKKLTGLVDEDNESKLSKDQNNILAELGEYNINFIGTCPGTSKIGSISVLLQVREGDSYSLLTNGCNSGTLKDILEEMFQALLENPNISSLVKEVKINENSSIGPIGRILNCAEILHKASCKDLALRKIFKSNVFACKDIPEFRKTRSDHFSDQGHGGYVTGMRLYRWVFNGKTQAISGIEVTYSDGASVLHGSDIDRLTPFEIKLDSQEKIVSASVRCCVLLDALTFITDNVNRKPFSTDGKGGEIFYAGPPTSAFLAYLEGTVDTILNERVVRNLKLVWEYI